MSEWNAHRSLHKDGRETEEGPDCRECAIVADHRERAQALRDEFGSYWAVPSDRMTALHEATRQLWIEMGDRDDGDPAYRRDKAQRFAAFVKEHHGEEATMTEIMAATDAAQGTVYAYIREMPLSFKKSGTSRWYVIDPARARADTLAAEARISSADGPRSVVTLSVPTLNDATPVPPWGHRPPAPPSLP